MDPQSLKDHVSGVQVVPMEASQKIDFTDSVVPDAKLKFTETSYFTTGTKLESYLFLSSESVQQMSCENQLTLATNMARPSRSSMPSLHKLSSEGTLIQNTSSSSVHVNIAQPARRRRNSSGSEMRLRRHSAAAPAVARNTTVHLNLHQRRRSHDVRDEQADILDRLCVVANTSNFSKSF